MIYTYMCDIYIYMIWWYMIDISVIILMINNISDVEIHISGDTWGPFLFVLPLYIYRYCNFFEACFLITMFIWSHLYFQDIFLRLRRNVRHWDPNRPETLGFLRWKSPWKVLKTVFSLHWLPQAIIEEAEIRWTEVQREVHEFEKDILKTISKKKGSILATQKVMKYIEDMNRRRVSWQVVRV